MHDHHHSIHLGAAWEPPAVMGSDGRLLWTRRFGRPGGLEPGDRVLLVVTQPTVAAEVAVNAVRLAPLAAGASRWEHDITLLLRDRNELLVTAPSSACDGPTHGQAGRGHLPPAIGTVSLEIVAADGIVNRAVRE